MTSKIQENNSITIPSSSGLDKSEQSVKVKLTALKVKFLKEKTFLEGLEHSTRARGAYEGIMGKPLMVLNEELLKEFEKELNTVHNNFTFKRDSAL